MKTNHFSIMVSYLLIAILITSCNRAGKSWEKAKINNKKEDYLLIIMNHSKSQYADSAFLSIKNILESENNIENSIKYFEFSLDTLSEGRFIDSINNNLKPLYEQRSLFIVLKDGKVGYINKMGEIIIEPIFTSGLDFYSNTAVVQQDSLWGIIDKSGKLLVEPFYMELCGFSEGLAAVKQDSLWGFINDSGNFVIPAKYSDAWPFSDGLALVELENKWGFIDKTGETVIDFTFDGAYYDENVSLELLINDTAGVFYIAEIGMMFIVDGANYVYKDFNNVPVIKREYEWLKLTDQFGFYDSYKSFSYANKDGQESISISDMKCVDAFSGDLARIFIDKKWGFIDKTEKQIISPVYHKCTQFIEDFALIEKNNGIGFINKLGKTVIKPNYTGARTFSEYRAPIRKNDKWGFIDTIGKIVIRPQFDESYVFCEDLAKIKLNKKYGFINKNGERVIKAKYVNAKSFNEDLAAVNVDEKWGYIDKTGQIVINFQFDEAENFKNGLAQVKIDKGIGYIDKKGVVVWEPTR